MGEIPHEFDWVTARAACSLEQIFNELKSGVEQDLRQMNDLRGLQPGTAFGVQSIKGSFIAHDAGTIHNIKFTLAADHIAVDDRSNGNTTKLIPTFTSEGQCKLVMVGEELELWQVRRRLLEGLLFPPKKR